jgi:hypothetical protein
MKHKWFTPENEKVVKQPLPAVLFKKQARAPAPHYHEVFRGKTCGDIWQMAQK